MKKTFTIVFVIVGLLTCISCGYLLSTILLSTNVFQLSSTITSEKQSIYVLSTNSSQNKEEVESMKTDLQSKNGGGVIYETEGIFYLLASAYENLTDAEKVRANLKGQGIESEILKIEIASLTIEGNFNNEEKNILQEAIKCKIEIFKSLYDVAISLDTNVFDLKKAKLECNNIFSNHIQTKTNLETFFKTPTAEISTLKTKLQDYSNCLSNLISENYDTASQTFSSLIKMTYLKILLN